MRLPNQSLSINGLDFHNLVYFVTCVQQKKTRTKRHKKSRLSRHVFLFPFQNSPPNGIFVGRILFRSIYFEYELNEICIVFQRTSRERARGNGIFPFPTSLRFGKYFLLLSTLHSEVFDSSRNNEKDFEE
ncbi:hypothetical protein CEXT_174881 [Caerostris extrusa]|uniref:Uncharacterized protein n=1 Tax=Caerostris extrusa TaxID=172846 RepID=A0AAV4U341_CAEEX|nr:hypothetical protein CEXT_174881 [Caerostris extrusa]